MQRGEGTTVNRSEITLSHMDSAHGLMDKTPKYGSFSDGSALVTRENPKTRAQRGLKDPGPEQARQPVSGRCGSNRRSPFFIDSFHFLGCTRAQLWCVGSQFPDQESNPGPLHGEHGVSATGPQESPKWEVLDTLLLVSDNHTDKELVRPQSAYNTTGCSEGSLSLEDTDGSQTRLGHLGTASRGHAHRDQVAGPCAQASSHLGQRSGCVIGHITLLIRNTSTISGQCRGQRENQKANYKNSYN